MRQATRKRAGRVLVVTHSLTIRCFVMRFLHLQVEDFDSMAGLANGAVVTLAHREQLQSPVFTSGRWGGGGPAAAAGLGAGGCAMTEMGMTTAPDRIEAAEYYFTYIDQVPAGDIREILEAQVGETLALLEGISEEDSLRRYALGKWSIRQVLSHVNDTERAFVFRALWFARGFDSPLPSFDQDVAIAAAGADERPWKSHVEEFRSVRAATLSFFRNLPADAWARRGIASGNPFTVRALAWIVAGHVTHHARILRERYLSGQAGGWPGHRLQSS